MTNPRRDPLESPAATLLAKRLNLFMRLQGINVHQLAGRAGITVRTADNILMRRRYTRLDIIERLADGLGIGVAELFGGREEKPKAESHVWEENQ